MCHCHRPSTRLPLQTFPSRNYFLLYSCCLPLLYPTHCDFGKLEDAFSFLRKSLFLKQLPCLYYTILKCCSHHFVFEQKMKIAVLHFKNAERLFSFWCAGQSEFTSHGFHSICAPSKNIGTFRDTVELIMLGKVFFFIERPDIATCLFFC